MRRVLTCVMFSVCIVVSLITTVQAAWWNKFGEPNYGGTITIAINQVGTNWDVLTPGGGGYFYEAMFFSDWTLDRDIWPFSSTFVPDQYVKGNLAESWEINDPQTITVRIREGIKWQDKPPVNGREFTAHDVQSHYERLIRESPMFAGMMRDWNGVTANLSNNPLNRLLMKIPLIIIKTIETIAEINE